MGLKSDKIARSLQNIEDKSGFDISWGVITGEFFKLFSLQVLEHLK